MNRTPLRFRGPPRARTHFALATKGEPKLDTTRELEAERDYLDRVARRLTELGVEMRRMERAALDEGASRSHEALVTRDVLHRHVGRRQLDLRIDGACFGRIDTDSGERFYIGRAGVSDADGDPMVIDWRAPVAEPFYRATPKDPMGLLRRRHFRFRKGELVGIDDDLLTTDADAAAELELVGEGALIAALEAPRRGRLGDIVATIQTEQDAVVRAPLSGITAVQGGPGTGKTVVALHRAAYLLYTHRFPLAQAGVLVVGPSALFLRYVEDVLPALGEHSVVLATVDELVPGGPFEANEPHAVARLKGDERMAKVIARAVRGRQRSLRRPLVVPIGAHRLTAEPETLSEIVARVRRRPGTHNERRAELERRVIRALHDDHLARVDRDVRLGHRTSEGRALSRRRFADLVRTTPELRAGLDRMWPQLTAATLVGDLFARPPLLAAAARGILTDAEVASLRRETTQGFTPADAPLLDEAAVHLGTAPAATGEFGGSGALADADEGVETPPPEVVAALDGVLREMGFSAECPTCESELEVDLVAGGTELVCPNPLCREVHGAADVVGDAVAVELASVVRHLMRKDEVVERPEVTTRTFGHIVVDEAQAVSAMAWRVLLRRCPNRSMTVVGDVAQASGEATDWETLLRRLTAREPGDGRGDVSATLTELTVAYRSPAPIVELAGRVLAEIAPELSMPRAVRQSGEPVRWISVGSPEELARTAADAVEEAAAGHLEGIIAVITPAGDRDLLAERLGVEPVDLDHDLVVASVDDARGLEFDSVVLVEPARIVAERDGALGPLFVAVTRATQHLTIVHHEPLPACLAPTLTA